MKAIDTEHEDMITPIFKTLVEFREDKKSLRPHLPLLLEAAIGIIGNADLQTSVR